MTQLCLKVGMIITMMLTVNGQQFSDGDNIPTEELSVVLRALLQPENYKYEMHRKSLQNALENMLAAAREPDYYEQFEEDDKRSIATLAKNGQLPSREPDTEMESLNGDDNGHKRNIASMARSGLIGGKRNIQSLARQWQYVNGKRNIGSIMRSNMFPGSGQKRNVASMARNGYGKRNVGTLARDWALPKFSTGSKYNMDDGKRNVGAFKNSFKNGRKKRETGEAEALEPVFQNGPLDYEELLQSLNDDLPYLMQNQAEKRFLVQPGSDSDPSTTITSIDNIQKRHIGAMARSGWIPSFRPTLNRFSRSGRTSKMEKIVEYYFPQDRLRPVPTVGPSCRRCELQNQPSGVRNVWGYSDNNLGLESLASAIRTRSGFRSTPPRVSALNWRDRL